MEPYARSATWPYARRAPEPDARSATEPHARSAAGNHATRAPGAAFGDMVRERGEREHTAAAYVTDDATRLRIVVAAAAL